MLRPVRKQKVSISSSSSDMRSQSRSSRRSEPGAQRSNPPRLRKSHSHRILSIVLASVLLAGCSSNLARFAPLAGKSFPPKDEIFEVAVFDSILPSREFERIARIEVAMEVPSTAATSLQDA